MPPKRMGEMVVFGSETAKDCIDMVRSSQYGRKVDNFQKLTVPVKKQWEAVYIPKTKVKLIGYGYTPYKSVMK